MDFARRTLIAAVMLPAVFSQIALSQDFATEKMRNWHQWRGPEANGFAATGNPPTEWSETKNVKWKVAIPGKGSASPIVWGDRIYLATAIPIVQAAPAPSSSAFASEPQVMAQRGGQQPRGGGAAAAIGPHKFELVCVDRRTGNILWQKTARETVPHEGHHATSTFASASPITDGKKVIVSFGSRGIHAYDMEGNRLWEPIDLGRMQTRNAFGEGASPALHGDSLVVPWDHQSGSFIAAFNANTGKEKWRKPREEVTTWATPLIVPYEGRVQVITNGMTRVRSYDLETGEVIWECGGQGPNPIPSPVVVDDKAIVMTGFQRHAAYAIPLNSKGDITESQKFAWKVNDGTPYVSSPLLYDGILYFTKERNNPLTTMNARTGEVLVNQKRLPGVSTMYASPVGAAGRVYLPSREGVTLVLKHGPEKDITVLASNQLDGPIDASPAIIGREMYIRTETHLYCIAENR
jgi:outer membrane protein assembly factor BamB